MLSSEENALEIEFNIDLASRQKATQKSQKLIGGAMGVEAQPNTGRVQTGIAGLDDVLGGGLPKGHLYLVEGNPGSGKTTLALQYLLEGTRRREPGLYVTLSESKSELHQVAESHGWSLNGISIQELAESDDSLLPEGQYTFFHPSEVELGQTTKTLIEAIEKAKPHRVVFDSLSELRLLARDPLRYRRQIMGLKHFFVGRDCTVMLLDDLTSVERDLQPQSLAHGVISLENLAPNYGSERRRLRVTKLRGARFRGGYHDFLIKTGGLEVFPRLVASEHRIAGTGSLFRSGLRELDDLLGGGIDRGTSNLFIGPAGSGKSSLATQFAYAAATRGEKSSFFIFDEGLDTFTLRAEGLGMPIKSYLESGTTTVQQIDPAELSPGQFIHDVRHVVESGSQLVVIDSLNGYLHAMPEERFLEVQLHELCAYLNQLGIVTILIMAQHGLVNTGNELGQAGNISYLADSALLLRFFEARGRVRKALSVIKKRSGPHEDTIREYILKEGGIRIGAPLTEFQGVLSGAPTFIGKQSELMDSSSGKA